MVATTISGIWDVTLVGQIREGRNLMSQSASLSDLSENSTIDAAIQGIEDELTRLRVTLSTRNAVKKRGITAKDVRTVILVRYRRRAVLGNLFADPGWEILLELFACALDRRQVNVVELQKCIQIPLSTVLRWLGKLNRFGLIERFDDPKDHRFVLLELSDRGRELMHQYFRERTNILGL